MTADYSGTSFRCDDDLRCPAGQLCVEGACQPDEGEDGGGIVDAGRGGADAGDAGGMPALLSWTATNALLAPRDFNHPHAGAVGGFIYLAGGFGGEPATEQTSVFFAELLPDGTVGRWSETSAALPLPRAVGDVVTAGDHIYVVGGAEDAVAQTTVYRGQVGASGDVAAWTATTPLPAARKGHLSFAANGYVYAIGGEDETGAIHRTAFVAPLEPDGEVGKWLPTAASPEPRAASAGVYANDSVYLLGGVSPSSTVHATSFVAPVKPDDGIIGPWRTTTDLPAARRSATAFARGGHIYLVGGITEGGDTSEVLHAPIGTDGDVGDWAPNQSLPAARARQASVLAGGFFYVIGGNGSDTVYYTPTD